MGVRREKWIGGDQVLNDLMRAYGGAVSGSSSASTCKRLLRFRLVPAKII
jgi:hypothetical protein